MLQVFHMNVVKVYLDGAYVAMAIHTCFKCFKCFICFRCTLQVFYPVLQK
jgi:hypothetical protein